MTGVPGLRIVAAASRLVPEARRAAWRAEWEAEATYAWRRLSPRGRPSAGVALERARLRWRVMTCVFDALSESMENVTMTGLSNDVRFALRGLLRRPGFTAVAVLTLSLGIGATTAVFTLLDGVVLSPLPYKNPDQLIQLDHADIRRDGQNELSISPGLYVVYRDHARTLSTVAMHSPTVLNLVVEGEAERVEGRAVTPSFFEVLGVSAARGRTFVEAEGRPGADPVIVLSDGLWAARFGSDPDVVGATVDVDGVAREVVGVMPPGFGFPDQDARFWIPLPVDDANAPIFMFMSEEGIARMREGQTLATTRAEIEGLFARLTDLAPPGPGRQFLQRANIEARISSLKESIVGDLQSTLWILFATVGIVLLIACANVANLLLVRAEARQRELALRVALGAGRLQVLRTFMGESLALALAGGALGVIVAGVAVRLTTSLVPTDLPRMAEIGVDARVLGFTAAVALACALFFGLFPLIRYSGKDLAGQLREGGGARGATGGRDRHRLRNGLVVSQIALALVLLIGSGLMMRSFLALRAVDPGFDPEHVLTARVSLPETEVADWQAVEQFYRQLRGQLKAQPGITDVGLVTGVPLANDASCAGVSVEDHPREPGELPVSACWIQSGAGYFEAMRIPVLQGRGFEPGDGADGFRAVVVSEAFAAKWWPNTSPLGRRMRRDGDEDWYTIVGVVDNVRQEQLEEVEQEMVYFPLVVDGNGPVRAARTVDVVIRTTGDPLVLVSMLRDQVRALNPRIPIETPRAMTDVFKSATARTSFTAAMLGAASGIALLLGLVGIYGVISYVVSQRTREIGVRMALGASGAVVRRMVVRQALMLSGTGVAVGLVAAALLSRVIGSMLYGVGAIDPLTYVVLALALIGAAVLACLIPAVRAASVDPSHALRAE